jgi:hypothetical protein
MIPNFSLMYLLVMTAALSACIYLFITLKRDIRGMEMRSLRRREKLREQLSEIAEEVETMRREIEVMEQRADPSANVTRALGSGVRIQALRMIKRGQGPEHISAALSIPRNEVELLIKVQRLMADQSLQPTS